MLEHRQQWVRWNVVLHDSLHMTDLDVIEVATIGVFPTNCDTLCVRCMSTWFQEIAGFLTIPSEQVMRPQVFD